MSGQGGGVTEASGAMVRHKPPNPLSGTNVPAPMDGSNRLETPFLYLSLFTDNFL